MKTVNCRNSIRSYSSNCRNETCSHSSNCRNEISSHSSNCRNIMCSYSLHSRNVQVHYKYLLWQNLQISQSQRAQPIQGQVFPGLRLNYYVGYLLSLAVVPRRATSCVNCSLRSPDNRLPLGVDGATGADGPLSLLPHPGKRRLGRKSKLIQS